MTENPWSEGLQAEAKNEAKTSSPEQNGITYAKQDRPTPLR